MSAQIILGVWVVAEHVDRYEEHRCTAVKGQKVVCLSIKDIDEGNTMSLSSTCVIS